jgi:D-glycero-D-manno-heptose 1,7-bisphosphate phosphatase
MKMGILIERDGILNAVRVERQQQVAPVLLADFRVNPEAAPVLEKLKAASFVIIATTNQPGLSLGGVSRRELDRMHDLLLRTLPLDDILVCPHSAADQCPCRKPQPGLLTEAAFKWHLDLDRSYVISDKWQDAAAARVVGATSLLLASPWIGPGHHDFVLPDLQTILDKILRLHTTNRTLAA